MTEENRREQTDLFREWVLKQTSPGYRLYIKENDPSTIVLESDCGRAEVTFFAQEIVQLYVIDLKTDRHIFYLHFQINSLEHACGLFNEMRQTLLELKDKPSAKILLCCASGLTTGFFAEKLNESASLLSLNYDFHAEPYSELSRIGADYDIILIAPQIYYAFDDIKKSLPGQTVLKIPSKIFASYDVPGLLEMITPYITGKTPKEKEALTVNESAASRPLPKRDLAVSTPMLAIAMINDGHRFQYAYQVLGDTGLVLFDSNVLKPKIDIYDLIDICDTSLALFPEIGMISLAMPGIIDEGRVSLPSQGLDDTDIINLLIERTGKKVVLENDANAIAIGYYASQDKYSSLSVLFQPNIGHIGGVGSIHNGRIITGKKHVAGEVQYLPVRGHDISSDEKDPSSFPAGCKTPEGALQLTTDIMACVISILGPELMVLCSHLIIHADTIAAKLEEYMPKAYIPEIILVNNVREYMLLGAVITGIKAVNALS